MAKLNAPLLSFSASGKLADALVYFGWKGLNVVRQYVVPSNPSTAAQVTQRGLLSNAVSRIHTAQARGTNPLDALDVAAYALWGTTYPTPRTWFNQLVKNMVDQQVDGNGYPAYYDGEVTPGASQAVLQMYAHYDPPDAATIFYGTSKTALINSEAASVAGSSISKTITGLTSGVKYFFQVRADTGDGSEGSESGIYYCTPT